MEVYPRFSDREASDVQMPTGTVPLKYFVTL